MTPLTCRCHAKIFATKEEYDQHADCNKIACDVCKILFKTKEKMLEHHSTVHGEFNVRPFKCDLCGDQFKRIEHLRSHLNYKHNNRERKFKCNYCDYKGKFQTDLNAHLKNHFDELKHVCRVCGKKFANIHGFRKHNIVDHGIKKIYLCNCGEGFLYFAELRSHKKTNICKTVSEQLQ